MELSLLTEEPLFLVVVTSPDEVPIKRLVRASSEGAIAEHIANNPDVWTDVFPSTDIWESIENAVNTKQILAILKDSCQEEEGMCVSIAPVEEEEFIDLGT